MPPGENRAFHRRVISRLYRMFQPVIDAVHKRLFPIHWKHANELGFWRWEIHGSTGGKLHNGHYQHFFTTHYGLTPEWYVGKRVLDIGCGPAGSLEWADGAAQRVGLDPLAAQYLKLGAGDHKMSYVSAPSERIPFPDGHFDVVSSFNSLDHVDDVDATIAEIKRVLKPGGRFLLITDVNHDPTPTEPHCFSWDIVRRFEPEMAATDDRRYEKDPKNLYANLFKDVRYDESNTARRYGLLSAAFQKR